MVDKVNVQTPIQQCSMLSVAVWHRLKSNASVLGSDARGKEKWLRTTVSTGFGGTFGGTSGNMVPG